MDTAGRLAMANDISTYLDKVLGKDFTPANQFDKANDPPAVAEGLARLKVVRRGPRVTPLDRVEMIKHLNEVSRRVRAVKQGCCGELAMYVFNLSRTREPACQIMLAEGKKGDRHAFVMLGVPTSYSQPVAIGEIADKYRHAIIVDYWAGCETYWGDDSKYKKGVYMIEEYESKASYSLVSYDLDKCTTMPFTGSSPASQ